MPAPTGAPMAYIVMAYIVMAYADMTYVVMAYKIMAYVVMAQVLASMRAGNACGRACLHARVCACACMRVPCSQCRAIVS